MENGREIVIYLVNLKQACWLRFFDARKRAKETLQASMDQSQQTRQQQSQQQQQPVVAGAGQMAYVSTPYQTAPMVATGTPSIAIPSLTQSPASFSNSPHQLTYQQAQHFHHQQQQQQQQQLQMFWTNQMQEIERTTDFKNHSLPLARIKKIMKADEDVRMISAEAPRVKCSSWSSLCALGSILKRTKGRTLQKNDIAAAISRTDVFDFLVDIIPRDELKEEGLGVTKATIPVGPPADLPYYYVPQHPVGPPGMIMGKPVDQAAAYEAQQPQPPVALMPWLQTQPQQQQSDT
ncbi:nuclear transcription factor Y subunit C-2-like [Populus alba x Populus x berolinensis]|nr:nuclear transcription factor Y subunit C-2-like [Populus alba x Populus x berolinensis]